MNEIRRYDFDGRVYDARVIDGEEWFTAAQVAGMLGHESPESVMNLYRTHRTEFLPHETCEMLLSELTTDGVANSEKPARRGNPRIKARLFSMDGVEHLAMLAKKAGVKLRRWCIDLRGRFRRGESAEITREQFDALKSERDALLADRNEWRTRALDGEMRIGRMEGRFEGLCVLLESRVSRDAGNVSDAKKHPDLMAIGRDKRRRDALEKAGRGRDVFLFDGMEGPDAFEALRAKVFEVVGAEAKKTTAHGRALKYRRHSFARLVKNCSHRQAIAAVESLVADGSIDVRGGNVSVATAMTTARKATITPMGGVA